MASGTFVDPSSLPGGAAGGRVGGTGRHASGRGGGRGCGDVSAGRPGIGRGAAVSGGGRLRRARTRQRHDAQTADDSGGRPAPYFHRRQPDCGNCVPAPPWRGRPVTTYEVDREVPPVCRSQQDATPQGERLLELPKPGIADQLSGRDCCRPVASWASVTIVLPQLLTVEGTDQWGRATPRTIGA